VPVVSHLNYLAVHDALEHRARLLAQLADAHSVTHCAYRVAQ
jgi:hypothetical protein